MSILVCTVGGSPQPIVKAIKAHHPTFVLFVCSSDDRVTGLKGSYTQVLGQGMVASSKQGGPPDLPNIPTQAGLREDQFDCIQVPTDDPVEIARILRDHFRELLAKGDVIADYTGGTKSMSAGMFLAAVQCDGVSLSLVGGRRHNLVRVTDGHERAQTVNVSSIRTQWLLDEARRCWRRYAYGEAHRLLDTCRDPSDEIDLRRVLSGGFATWDAFDHKLAYEMLHAFGGHLRADLMPALAQMQRDGDRADPLRIVDLVHASARRAAAAQFDSATLLLYRSFEWIGQWSLRVHHGVQAGDVPDSMKERLDGLLHANHKGKLVLGMHNLWTALARLQGPLAAVGEKTHKSRLGFAELRNTSLYAHGTRPITEADYLDAKRWFETEAYPQFIDVAFKGTPPFQQLPDTW